MKVLRIDQSEISKLAEILEEMIEENEKLRKALEFAVEKLKDYAYDDENANVCGFGCYGNPMDVVSGWIEEINRISGCNFEI